MTLLDSLLDAIVRLDGDALVMHVGEKPYVVTTSSAMNAYRGPLAWGQVELSSRVLTPDAVLSMVGQILPEDQRHALEEVGAVEHEIAGPAGVADRFSVVAARGGDDIWLELRRLQTAARTAADAGPAAAAAGAEPAAPSSAAGQGSAVGIQEPPVSAPDVVRGPAPEPEVSQTRSAAAEDIRTPPPAAAPRQAESIPAAEAPPQAVVPGEAQPPQESLEQHRAEEPIEERVPVLDEVTHDEAEHVEHFIIAVNGRDRAAGEREANAAMELIEPELQYAPTEDDVDAMLAATAASLLAANLEPEPQDAGAAGADRERGAEFSPDSFEVVIDDDEAESDLTSALNEIPAAPWSAEPAAPPVAPAQAPAFELPEARAEVGSGAGPLEERPPDAATTASETQAIAQQPETQADAVPSLDEIAAMPVAEPAAGAHPSTETPAAHAGPPRARVAAGTREAVEPASPADAQVPVAPAASPDVVEFVPHDASEEAAGEPAATETEILLDRNALPGSPGVTPVSAHPTPGASAQDAPRSRVVIPIDRPAERLDRTGPAARLDDERLLEILRVAAERGASTVYVVAQSKPMLRVDGDISALDDESVLTAAEVERIVAALAPPRTSSAAMELGVEWISEVPQVGRVRSVTFRDHRGPGLILRLTSATSISAEHLNLSPAIRELCTLADGLVLVAGARGSGKSTLLNSFVDLINRTRSEHVITIETEIGFVHESRRSFVSQRETPESGAASAVSAALRENPDVLVIEDVQSPEIAAAALHAAESGRLVFASIAAPSSAAALEGFLNLIPDSQRSAARAGLAGALRAVVAQLLLPKASGGRVTARELLLNSPAVSAAIRTGDAKGVAAGLDAGGRYGMLSLTEAIAGLVRSGTVHAAEGYRRTPDRQALLAALARDGVDPSFAERLA